MLLNTNVQRFVLQKCNCVYLNLYTVNSLQRALLHGYFLNSEQKLMDSVCSPAVDDRSIYLIVLFNNTKDIAANFGNLV